MPPRPPGQPSNSERTLTVEGIATAGTLLAAGLHATGGNGFDRAIAGTGPVFLGFLVLHIPAGLTAVIAGPLAATAPKRHGRHTCSGTVYYWAIAVVFATATAMAAIRPADWYLALLGALTFALAAAGRDYRRRPGRRPWRRWPGHTPHILAMGSSYVVLLTAFYVDNGKKIPLLDQLPTAAYWVLPALIATPLITRSSIRHRNPPPAAPGQGHAPDSG
jgi:lysylphosphatidylglycerol synthetase-like protein (DUF2156 family)